jgi:hypothetical protein
VPSTPRRIDLQLPWGCCWKASISGASGSSVLVKFQREGRLAVQTGQVVFCARHPHRDGTKTWDTIAYNDSTAARTFLGIPWPL